jgi:hypothetical protein
MQHKYCAMAFGNGHANQMLHIRALMAGSLCSPDAVLTTAFHEQMSIGWLHLCLGKISTKWSTAASQYSNPRWTKSQADQWSSLIITGIWRYSKTLWRHRNEVVHGTTVAEQAQNLIKVVQNSVSDYYDQFSRNNTLIIPRHEYLFTSKTLEQRIMAPYDILSAWLHSVEEAIQVVQFQDAQSREDSRRYFEEGSIITFSSDSSYEYESSTSTSVTASTCTCTDSSHSQCSSIYETSANSLYQLLVMTPRILAFPRTKPLGTR